MSGGQKTSSVTRMQPKFEQLGKIEIEIPSKVCTLAFTICAVHSTRAGWSGSPKKFV